MCFALSGIDGMKLGSIEGLNLSDTRRHDSPAFVKESQRTLLTKLFDCNTFEEVLTTGYGNALLHITQTIDKLMNGEVQVTDLVISRLLRQNIEKYRSLFPHVAAAIRLNIICSHRLKSYQSASKNNTG